MLDEMKDRGNGTTDSRLVSFASERAILACLMKEPVKMIDCSTKLTPEDFAGPNNRYLYRIMSHIFAKSGGKKCDFDITSLIERAKELGKEEQFLEASGGRDQLEFLKTIKDSDGFVSLENFDGYVDTIYSLSVKRKLLDNAEAFKEKIFSTEVTPEELMVQEQKELDNILISKGADTEKISNVAGLADDYLYNGLWVKKRDIVGIKTGFSQLDRTIEGLKRKNLVIVCAPKKTGKSAFLMNIGLNVGVRQNIPTLMVSTEMPDEEILTRCLSNLSGIREQDVIKGSFNNQDEQAKVIKAQAALEAGSFYHLFMPGFTLEKVIAVCRKFVNNTVGFNDDGTVKDCLFMFDYIKMPQVGLSAKREEKEYKVLGQMADALKILSGQLDIPILTACQTNRGGDVANSFELTWFCNTFMILQNKTDREMQKEEGEGGYMGNQKLRITDNRGGEENHKGINIEYNKPLLKMTEVHLGTNR